LPIYTYECQSCSSTLERRQSFSDEPLKVHDECGGGLRRVIHPAGIVFKGSGFYNTDYKNSTGSNKSTTDEKDSKSSDSTTSESSSETAASTNGTASSSSDSSAAKTESKPAAASATPAPSTP
jgi:putative FmdB family regulatory protein